MGNVGLKSVAPPQAMSTFSAQQQQLAEAAKGVNKTYPRYSTGARTFIQVAGKPLALAMEFNYTVTAETEEIRTIDTSFPWDIVVGQVKITGTLRKIVDPDTSFESEGLFHTMQSIIHQPMIEILVQDVNGNAQFFSRGMFTGVQSGFVKGAVTIRSANFVGVSYQHWAYQPFTPYPTGVSAMALKTQQAANKLARTMSRYGL